MPRNVGDLGKLIAAKGFQKLPKVQKITKSGHTAYFSGVEIHRDLWYRNCKQCGPNCDSRVENHKFQKIFFETNAPTHEV